ncbi:hypothetical protein XENTR_v10012386 [Xenopus tropicalis]|nr:hypothetical protein XENTR_v10012386 [Xenopus tropicalis]
MLRMEKIFFFHSSMFICRASCSKLLISTVICNATARTALSRNYTATINRLNQSMCSLQRLARKHYSIFDLIMLA